MDYASAVVRARFALELTQSDFGRALGVHQVTVARWETGVRVPTQETMKKIGELMSEMHKACPMCGHEVVRQRDAEEWRY